VTLDMGDGEQSGYRTTSPQDAARIILNGVEAGRLYIYVGIDSRLMSLAVKVAPKRAMHLIQRHMKRLLE
jgi:short-subunit dehydrogenase